MPLLNKEQFETPPKVGDVITITGTVQSIDKNGTVEVSYDDIENKGDQGDEEGMEKPMNAADALDAHMKTLNQKE